MQPPGSRNQQLISPHCLNTKIYSYLETSGGKSYNLDLNFGYFFNISVKQTSVVASDSCFPELVSNTCCHLKKHVIIVELISFRSLSCLMFMKMVSEICIPFQWQPLQKMRITKTCCSSNQGMLKGGSITVPLTSCLTGLESAV